MLDLEEGLSEAFFAISPFIQTLTKPTKRGGKRLGSGPKVNIPATLIAYDVALKFDIGLYQAKEKISEKGANRWIGDERLRNLRKWGTSKHAAEYLAIHRETYLKRRKKLGFKP